MTSDVDVRVVERLVTARCLECEDDYEPTDRCVDVRRGARDWASKHNKKTGHITETRITNVREYDGPVRSARV
jgi:hypothetical protein